MRSEARRAPLRGLYAVTPEMHDTRRLVTDVAAALAGGAALVQYRAETLPAALATEQCRALVEICRAAGVPLIVNDSLDLALACGADGVHLGRDDVDARQARERFREGVIGVSCYDDLQLARAARQSGADYVAIGSVFRSSTKPSAVHADLELLQGARQASSLPVAAIGGITAANASRAIDAGADMIAVISALFDAPDIQQAAQNFVRLFDDRPSGSRDVRTQPQAL